MLVITLQISVNELCGNILHCFTNGKEVSEELLSAAMRSNDCDYLHRSSQKYLNLK